MSSVIIKQSPSEWSTTMRYQENFGGSLSKPTQPASSPQLALGRTLSCSEVSTLKSSLKRSSSFDAYKENASGGKQVNFEQLVEVRDFESEPPDDASGDQALSPGSQSPYFARGGVDAQSIVSPMMRSSPPQESRVENMVTTAPLKPAGSAGPAPSAPKLLQRPQVAPGSPKPINPHSPHSPPPSMVASHTKPPTMQPPASPLVQALKPEMQRSAAPVMQQLAVPVMQQSAEPLRSLASVELEKRQAERTRYHAEMEAYKKSLQDANEQLRRQAEAEIQQLVEEEEKKMQQQTDERTQIPWLAVATTEIQLSDIRQAQLNAPPQTSLVPPAPPLQKPATDELNTSVENISAEDILKTWRQEGKTRGADTWNDRRLSQMIPLTPRKELQGDAYVHQQTAGQRAQAVAPGGAHAVGFGVVSVLKAEMQRSAAPVMQQVMQQPDSPEVGESNLCNTSKLKLEEAENSFKRLQELQMVSPSPFFVKKQF